MKDESLAEDTLDDTPSLKFIKTLSGTLLPAILGFISVFFKNSAASPYIFPIISVLSIALFAFLTYRYLTNVITFSALFFLLTVVFPLLHFFIYKSDKSNYNFEPKYLNHKAKILAQDSISHIDTFYLSNLVRSNNDSLLNSDLNKFSHDNIILLNSYLLKFEQQEDKSATHPGVFKTVLGLYQSNGKKVGILEIGNSKTLNEIIEKERNLFIDITTRAKNPDANIFINDFWIESITGFAFSHIKPITNLAISIRVFQLIFAFLFLAMITNTLRASGKFVLESKKEK